ncbi:MAG: Chromosome segregation ATPase-like protein, partial [Acidobacteriaceae bacterium]|nr:Chromosome segregation ATPase-like protein [Acidobacteriaceae bacterium]
MPDINQVEQIVERVVSRALENHLPQLRKDIVQGVFKELQSSFEAAAAQPLSSNDANPDASADLLKAISSIHAGGNQKEILRALLDCTTHYSGRSALFVIKSGLATGWEARGFANSDDVKDFALDVTSGLVAQTLQSRAASRGMADQVDPAFVSHFKASRDGRVLILPLLLKDKIAALVYVDAGADENGKIDTNALEILVTATGAWLEVASLRKQAQKDGSSDSAGERFDAPPPAQPAQSFSDPFASHAPMHVAAKPPVATMETATATVERVPAAMAVAAPSSAPVASTQLSPEDSDTHRKAQRFARLLSDEIKLYN